MDENKTERADGDLKELLKIVGVKNQKIAGIHRIKGVTSAASGLPLQLGTSLAMSRIADPCEFSQVTQNLRELNLVL